MSTDLLFKSPLHLAQPIELVFGATDTAPLPAVQANVASSITAISFSSAVKYDNRAPRHLHRATLADHQAAKAAEFNPALAWGLSCSHKDAKESPWQSAQSMQNARAVSYAKTQPFAAVTAAQYERASKLSAHAQALIEAAQSMRTEQSNAWQCADAVSTEALLLMEVAQMFSRRSASIHEVAGAVAASMFAPTGVAHAKGKTLEFSAWEVALRLILGRTPYPTQPVVVPPVYVGNPHLLFQCPSAQTWHLLFGEHPCSAAIALPQGLSIIPAARFYMSVHSLTCKLIPSNEAIPVFGLSLSADKDSFGWSFRAQAPGDAFEALTPTPGSPKRVQFTLDGMVFGFVITGVSRLREFGKTRTSFSGISPTTLLKEPWQNQKTWLNTEALNAQQLAQEALALTGIALDWAIDDWQVPAGAWSHSGTPLSAVQAIAESAGGYLASERNADTLRVMHPYPTLTGGLPGSPWNWALQSVVPDVELAQAAVVTENIEVQDKALVNGVYLSGQTKGILAYVKRAGTAGTPLAPMLTDPLMTAEIAAQQRGLAVIGASGAKQMVTLNLPVLTGSMSLYGSGQNANTNTATPGIIDVGKLVQINFAQPIRGRVRSVSVDASLPKVRQSIVLEQHI